MGAVRTEAVPPFSDPFRGTRLCARNSSPENIGRPEALLAPEDPDEEEDEDDPPPEELEEDPVEPPPDDPEEPDDEVAVPEEPLGMAWASASTGTASPTATAKEVSARIDLVMRGSRGPKDL